MLRKNKMTTASEKETITTTMTTTTTTIDRNTETESQHKNFNECRCWFGCHHHHRRRHHLCCTPLHSLLCGNKWFSADEQWIVYSKKVFHMKKDFQEEFLRTFFLRIIKATILDLLDIIRAIITDF